MEKSVFYFDLIKKYTLIIGSLLNDIRIYRTDSNHNNTQLIKVPLMYAPKDKMMARIMQDPNIDRQTSTITLPIITFELGQIRYNNDSKLNTVGKIAYKSNRQYSNTANSATIFSYQFNPVPYAFEFKAYIYVKNMEDGTKILEQILPYFTPDWTITAKLIPEMEEEKNIVTVLKNVNYEDNYSSNFEERRAIIWTLNLELKGYLYGPVKQAPIINEIINNMYIDNDGYFQSNGVANNYNVLILTSTPGLDANNNPTSNASITINTNQIEATDNYGFIQVANSNVK